MLYADQISVIQIGGDLRVKVSKLEVGASKQTEIVSSIMNL